MISTTAKAILSSGQMISSPLTKVFQEEGCMRIPFRVEGREVGGERGQADREPHRTMGRSRHIAKNTGFGKMGGRSHKNYGVEGLQEDGASIREAAVG